MDSPTQHTTLAIDGHVHLYPQYDWVKAVNALISNLTTAVPPAGPGRSVITVGLLAESKTNRFFRDVRNQGTPLTQGALQVEAGPDSESLVIRQDGELRGYLIAGRQLVTREKLEVLALCKNSAVPDGHPLDDTLQAVTAEQAVPVLSWSPGKWFFGRGKLIAKSIQTQSPGSFLVGDIGLRPTVWGVPRLMSLARQRGFKVIGGSDALPLPGEERWIGASGFMVTGAFDPQHPTASIHALLTQPGSACIPIGKQSTLPAFACRWGRNQLK